MVATFVADYAGKYEATAWCEVEGRAARLPLVLEGEGLGPRAMFSQPLLDVGRLYINTPHNFELELMNRCAIGFFMNSQLHDFTTLRSSSRFRNLSSSS